MGKSLVIAVKVQQNATTKLAFVHEQSEFTYGAYLVAAGHLNCRDANPFVFFLRHGPKC